MNAMKILDWRPMRWNSLPGFVKIEMPSGLVIADVTVLGGERGAWASPPSKPMLGRDGIALKDQNGKIKYCPIIEFTSKEVRDRFSTGVIQALRREHPDALVAA
jgi:hypothetical protein